jgi:hypothetical protein
MNKKALWLKVKNYHFEHIVPPSLWEKITTTFSGDNPFTKAFADKIARKHHWNENFALQCVYEYKKFIYLGTVATFHVTPSKYIDIVWHEHILFTKAYQEFCETILEQDFHHFPELYPMEEQTGVFNAQYLETITLYETEFGVLPPLKIWELTKYDKEAIINGDYNAKEKKEKESISRMSLYNDETPLHFYFDQEEIITTDFPEFIESGGDFGGSGATGDFGDDSSGGCSGGCGGGD